MRNSTDYISDSVVKNLNVLAHHYYPASKFREAFNGLSDYHRQCYFHITMVVSQYESRALVMSRILDAIEKDQAVSIFYDLLKKNQDFAFNTLSVTSCRHFALFRTLFGKLNQYKEGYIKHVIKKQKGSCVMFCILNKMGKDQAVSTFYDLLKKNQDFAFNTLDVTVHRSINLLKTLFSQLNSQQEEDYEIHLETKPKVRAQFTLRKFYSNNKNGASKLKTKNSNKDNLDNESLAQKRKRAGLDEFSKFNPGTFFPNPVRTCT